MRIYVKREGVGFGIAALLDNPKKFVYFNLRARGSKDYSVYITDIDGEGVWAGKLINKTSGYINFRKLKHYPRWM